MSFQEVLLERYFVSGMNEWNRLAKWHVGTSAVHTVHLISSRESGGNMRQFYR